MPLTTAQYPGRLSRRACKKIGWAAALAEQGRFALRWHILPFTGLPSQIIVDKEFVPFGIIEASVAVALERQSYRRLLVPYSWPALL